MDFTIMKQTDQSKTTSESKALVNYSEIGKVIFNFISGTHTSIISNDKIKKGHLPDESESFLASIVMNRNGNYDRNF